MLKPAPDHPGASLSATSKVCADLRCATLLDDDAEICDECGGTLFTPLQAIGTRLCGWDGDRPVVFRLREDKPAIVGRSSAEHTPEVDLRRFAGSEVVHRRHARIEFVDNQWRLCHLGTNALLVVRDEPISLQTGQQVNLRSGDRMQVGNVVLQFITR
jgi:hypothetical protein